MGAHLGTRQKKNKKKPHDFCKTKHHPIIPETAELSELLTCKNSSHLLTALRSIQGHDRIFFSFKAVGELLERNMFMETLGINQ